MSARTVKVSNISLSASERDIKEFFSFSGDIAYVEMQSESERSQLAYVTFNDSQGADTATLLSGATIVDMSVNVTPVENYQLPPEASKTVKDGGNASSADSAVNKAEDVVSSMLAKGFVLGKDALAKAKAFDERHHFTSNASSTITSFDQKIGLSDKINVGAAVVNEKVREVDNRFQVSEITKSAIASAEQKASSVGSVLMSNRYIWTSAAWLSGAYSKVAKAAGDVSVMTKEKMDKAEAQKMEMLSKERTGMVNQFAEIHLEQSLPGEPAIVPVNSSDEVRVTKHDTM